MTTIYHDPDVFGLQLIASHDAAPVYEFDIVGLWRDRKGAYWIGHDRDSSGPIPFAGMAIRDLTPVGNVAEVAAFARGAWDHLDDHSWYLAPEAQAEAAVAAFMGEVVSVLDTEVSGCA